MNTDQQIISHTRVWIESVVIGLNLCPFTQREFERQSIQYRVVRAGSTQEALLALIGECVLLDEDQQLATTLLIYPKGFDDFDDFLDLTGIADALLTEQGYEGIYQLASFHPHYCFADAGADDPANYTNRSPYPMLHLLREADIDRALEYYDQPEQIPQRNISRMRALGITEIQTLLQRCYAGSNR
jgi:hypothetical protein